MHAPDALTDTRLAHQRDALIRLLTQWTHQGQIPGMLDYATLLTSWLSRLSDGSPVTALDLVTEGERSDPQRLLDFLAGITVDLDTFEAVIAELTQALDTADAYLLQQSRRWSAELSGLESGLDAAQLVREQAQTPTWTESFTASLGCVCTNTTIDPLRGLLSLAPLRTARVLLRPIEVVVTITPGHHPEGGVTHTGLDTLSLEHATEGLIQGPGFERWVFADVPPSVTQYGRQWPGIICEVTLIYPGTISFTGLDLLPRTTTPVTLIGIEVAESRESPWRLVIGQIGGSGTSQITIRDLPKTTAQKVKVVLYQPHAEVRTPRIISQMADEATTYERALNDIEDPTHRRGASRPAAANLYRIGLYRIHLHQVTFASLSVGEYWSHAEGQAYNLPDRPIDAVRLFATYSLPGVSTIEWWCEEVSRGLRIPLLPTGVTVYREPATLLPNGDLVLTFPLSRGTTPTLYVNGERLDPNTHAIEEVMSRTLRVSNWNPARPDSVVIEYQPAIGKTVMAYVIRPADGVVTIHLAGGSDVLMTTENAIFVSRGEADKKIAVLPDPKPAMSSHAVMVRADEWDYWFFGGTEEWNRNRTRIPLPVVLALTPE